MTGSSFEITEPIVHEGEEIWFAAYGFGWGYRAFSLPADLACEKLGAAGISDSQLQLAFQLGQRTIRNAVELTPAPAKGERAFLPSECL